MDVAATIETKIFNKHIATSALLPAKMFGVDIVEVAP